MIKNYGLLLSDVRDEKAYRLGSSNLPKYAINPSKDWTAYLPIYEPQFNSFFDSYGCTVWGSLNAKEILLKFLLKKEYNFSERFNYILAKITPPGADPHTVIEVIRKNGVIDDALLPMTENFFQFTKPDPMTDEFVNKGMKFEYELKHEWVWERSDKLTKAKKHELIRECLAYSPLGVSVTAWSLKDGVYVDNGRPNTHWCVLVGENSKGWVVFDSYGQDLKTLSFEHNIEVCKRFLLAPSTREIERNILLQIVDKLLQLIGLYKPTPVPIIAPVAPQPVVVPPQPIIEPRGSLLLEWATAIRDYEGKPGDMSYRNNNPGNLRSVKGPFIKFKTWEAGWAALLDYLTRAATGKHRAYKPDFTLLQFFKVYAPSADNNDPNKYASHVAKRLGVPVTEKIKNLI